MRERLGTATGRGLVAARNGDIIVLAAVLLFLATGLRPWVLVVGVLLAGLPGLVSARRIWVGRFEFGPEHAAAARRGIYLFAVASILLVLSLLSFQTFPSPSLGLDLTGDEAPRDETRIHRFRDLAPPVVFVATAFAAEALSAALILWNLVGREARIWVAAHASVGGGAFVALLTVGLGQISSFQAETGLYADSTPAAQFYYDRFLDAVLSVAGVALLLSRAAALLLLRRAIAKVAQAERDAEPSASEPAPSP